MRKTPPWLTLLGVLVLVTVVGVGLVAFHRTPAPLPARPTPSTSAGVTGAATGHWTALATPPLSARYGAVGGWTGRYLLVVGGSDTPCLVDCPAAGGRRDGAAYEPLSRTWSRLPPAPVPVGPGSIAATTGATLVVATADHRFATLDTPAHRWRRLPDPGFAVRALTGTAEAMYAVGHRVAVLDAADSRWNALPAPPQPIRPATEATAYVGGLALVDRGVLQRWDGRRWTTTAITRPGRVDPVTGAWQRLPAGPGPAGTSFLTLPDNDGRPTTSGDGQVWVPGQRSWVALTSPTPRLTDATVVYAEPRIYLLGGLRVDRSGTDATALTRSAWVWSP